MWLLSLIPGRPATQDTQILAKGDTEFMMSLVKISAPAVLRLTLAGCGLPAAVAIRSGAPQPQL